MHVFEKQLGADFHRKWVTKWETPPDGAIHQISHSNYGESGN